MAWEKNILALKVTEKNILARLKNPGPPWKSNGRSLRTPDVSPANMFTSTEHALVLISLLKLHYWYHVNSLELQRGFFYLLPQAYC